MREKSSTTFPPNSDQFKDNSTSLVTLDALKADHSINFIAFSWLFHYFLINNYKQTYKHVRAVNTKSVSDVCKIFNLICRKKSYYHI